jgi:hypothetical protein
VRTLFIRGVVGGGGEEEEEEEERAWWRMGKWSLVGPNPTPSAARRTIVPIVITITNIKYN